MDNHNDLLNNIVEDVVENVVEEFGMANLFFAACGGVAGGIITFLSILFMLNNKEEF